MNKFKTEDWVVTFLSLPLLLIAGIAAHLPGGGPKIPQTLVTAEAWLNIGMAQHRHFFHHSLSPTIYRQQDTWATT